MRLQKKSWQIIIAHEWGIWRGNMLMFIFCWKPKFEDLKIHGDTKCSWKTEKKKRIISLLSSFREEVYLVPCSRDHLNNVLYVWPVITRIWWRIHLSMHSTMGRKCMKWRVHSKDKNHFLMSSGASEWASERTNERSAERACETSSAKRANKMGVSERANGP